MPDPSIDIEGTRAALFAWGKATADNKKGVLYVNNAKKRLEFVELSKTSLPKTGQQKQSMQSLANFVDENFDIIVKSEDLASESSLKTICEQFDKHIITIFPGNKIPLTERLKSKIAKSKIAKSLEKDMLKDLQETNGDSRAKTTIKGIVSGSWEELGAGLLRALSSDCQQPRKRPTPRASKMTHPGGRTTQPF